MIEYPSIRLTPRLSFIKEVSGKYSSETLDALASPDKDKEDDEEITFDGIFDEEDVDLPVLEKFIMNRPSSRNIRARAAQLEAAQKKAFNFRPAPMTGEEAEVREATDKDIVDAIMVAMTGLPKNYQSRSAVGGALSYRPDI